MKKFLGVFISAVIAAGMISGCSGNEKTGTADNTENELIVFAAASMTDTMNEIAEMYKAIEPDVNIVYNFDSSGTLKTQIQEGADCDIFISAAQKQMNQLDVVNGGEANTENLDFVDSDTRFNLVSNSVVLITPEGNPAGIESFEDVGTDKVKLIALGNSDVPVGQYSEEIFTYMDLWDKMNEENKITFGTNVREVLAQVEEGSVDCGVVYSTDAAISDKVEVVASAPENSHKEITYPAAVLKTSDNAEEAKKFTEYLKTDECTEVFEKAGFVVNK